MDISYSLPTPSPPRSPKGRRPLLVPGKLSPAATTTVSFYDWSTSMKINRCKDDPATPPKNAFPVKALQYKNPLLKKRSEATKGEQALVMGICNNRQDVPPIKDNPNFRSGSLSHMDAWWIAKGTKISEWTPRNSSIHPHQGSELLDSDDVDDSEEDEQDTIEQCNECKQPYNRTPKVIKSHGLQGAASSDTALRRIRAHSKIPPIKSCNGAVYIQRLSLAKGDIKPSGSSVTLVDVYLPRLDYEEEEEEHITKLHYKQRKQ